MDRFEMLRDEEVNIEYLPCIRSNSFNEDCLANLRNNDVLIIADSIENSLSIDYNLPNLKDSSKGYIDAMLESKKADLSTRSIYVHMAEYVKEDLRTCYPIKNEGIDHLWYAYDNVVFYPSLNANIAYPYIFYLLGNWNRFKIDVYNEVKKEIQFENDRIRYNVRNEESFSLYNYRIIVLFPKLQKSGELISELVECTNAGALVLLPNYINNSMAEEIGYIRFKNRKDLNSKISYYMANDEEREKVSQLNRNRLSLLETISGATNRVLTGI